MTKDTSPQLDAASQEQDLAKASQAQLADALRQTEDEELRVEAACATGDQLRFGDITSLDAELRDALTRSLQQSGQWTDLSFEAAIALCEAQDAGGARLVETLGDKTRRFDACKALSRLRTPQVGQALAALARKAFIAWPDRLVASAACAVLGDKDGARYFEKTLVARWFTSRRAMALHLLGELRHPEAYTVLLALIDNQREPLRHVAIRALGHLGDARAIAPLKQIADRDVEEDVAYALNLLVHA